MDFKRELSFFQAVVRQLHLPIHIVPKGDPFPANLDLGLRRSLCPDSNTEYKEINHLESCVIYQLTDEFTCKYTVLLIPDDEVDQISIIGPYIADELDRVGIQNLTREIGMNLQWAPVLEAYFHTVPYLQHEELLIAAVNTLAERVWNTTDFTWEHIVSGVPERWIPLSKPTESLDTLNSISGVERRYEAENRLMQAVSQGRSHAAELMLANFSQAALEQRTPEPIRNTKNYTIILNTIMRKAAEQGGVHPIYIDRVSSGFALRIEALSGWQECSALWQEMARKYCLLVKKHANKPYSPLVQKVIARIEFDLAADLSLKANAEALNVNASYLSTLFKKETGTTLTDYVNRKRVEHAVFLLNTTNSSISAVGQRCGIQDDNYFTKIFKKYTNKTPKQYRQENYRFTQSGR